MTSRHVIGVDVGGSGVKAAVVELPAGHLPRGRERRATPKPATPAAIAEAVAALVRLLDCEGPVGITLPCVVHDGIAESAVNIDRSWIGTDAVQLFRTALGGRPIAVLNDADAAGLAEARYGPSVARRGTVLVLTIGTGIGSALLRDGVLVPSTEFGHVTVDGHIGERIAARSVREVEGLSWDAWADRANRYLAVVESIIRLDLIVIGGGISNEAGEWMDLVSARAPILAAKRGNDAGIVGAAMHAAESPDERATATSAVR